MRCWIQLHEGFIFVAKIIGDWKKCVMWWWWLYHDSPHVTYIWQGKTLVATPFSSNQHILQRILEASRCLSKKSTCGQWWPTWLTMMLTWPLYFHASLYIFNWQDRKFPNLNDASDLIIVIMETMNDLELSFIYWLLKLA